MIRYFRIVAVVLLFALSVQRVEAQFALGARLGYSNVLHGESTTDVNGEAFTLKSLNSNGFNLGLMMRAGSKVFMQVEGYYQLNKMPYFNSDTTLTFSERYSTVELPVLLGFKVVDLDKFNWRFMIGPRFRFSAGAKSNIDTTQFIVVSNKWQLGLSVGSGFDIGPVTLDFKYNLTSNIFTTSLKSYADATPTELKRMLLHGFEASIGYKFVDIRRTKSTNSGNSRSRKGS
ncbi:MAG: outer membrane beta-barrel protein [Bacteroidales bacterium]|nr:outer membrane beta-barrel protein [Bacteroidales bacterium]